MVHLCWTRPSPEQQKACLDRYPTGSFNYDTKHRGASAKPFSSSLRESLSKDGFSTNHTRVLIGSGLSAFNKGKAALQSWKHFGLNWAFVDPKTPVASGVKFCVCVQEFLPWLLMPLQVAYVNQIQDPKSLRATFGFGSGTLNGHLLSGEERFSIELDEKNQVWYEVLSFSKPAHLLSFVGYPYVLLRQKYFAHQSAQALLSHVTDQPSKV
ncbi:hypothetical protein Syun_005534 [Stephania yunnanensis]|uniref:DUF1990 domain-containing protein n=1 Tax=Stephania yunnanensis TaxID=152371 RepID=A0AAP0Q1U4_9MAGN